MSKMKTPEYERDASAQEFIQQMKVAKFSLTDQDDLFGVVDKPAARPDHTRMTDLTRQEIDAKLATNKAELDARLADFDASIKTGFAELRVGFAEMRAEMAKQSGDMRTDMANVRSETHKGTIDTIKWVIGTILAVAAATVSILTFVINNAAPKTPLAATAQQQVPTVIAVPHGSTLLSTPQAAPTSPPSAK